MRTAAWICLILLLLWNAGNKVNDAYDQGWAAVKSEVRSACQREWTTTCDRLLGKRRY